MTCPSRSQVTQSFRRPPAQAQQLTSGSTSSTTSASKPLVNTQQVNPSAPSPNFTCHDFNHRFCRRVNCQFLHICSNQGCGGAHPSTHALKEFNNLPSSLSHLPSSTPICIPNLVQELKHYPNQKFATDLLNDLQFGCRIGYQGPCNHRITPNLKSTLFHPEAATDVLHKEISRGHKAGPFSSLPLPALQCSPLGVVPKRTIPGVSSWISPHPGALPLMTLSVQRITPYITLPSIKP